MRGGAVSGDMVVAERDRVCLSESFDLVSAELNQKEGKVEITAALNRVNISPPLRPKKLLDYLL